MAQQGQGTSGQNGIRKAMKAVGGALDDAEYELLPGHTPGRVEVYRVSP